MIERKSAPMTDRQQLQVVWDELAEKSAEAGLTGVPNVSASEVEAKIRYVLGSNDVRTKSSFWLERVQTVRERRSMVQARAGSYSRLFGAFVHFLRDIRNAFESWRLNWKERCAQKRLEEAQMREHLFEEHVALALAAVMADVERHYHRGKHSRQ